MRHLKDGDFPFIYDVIVDVKGVSNTFGDAKGFA